MAETAPQSLNPIALPTVIATPAAPMPGSSPEKEAQKILDSTRFSQLSKKEAALVRERDLHKKELESFKKEREEFEKIRSPLMEGNQRLLKFDELLTKDPIEAMKFAGFSETHLMNFLAASEDKSTPEEKTAKLVQEEMKKFREEQTSEKSKVQKESEEKTIQKFREDVKDFVAKDQDKYEYCNFYGDQARELIEEIVSTALNAEESEMLSIQEATELAEQYYEEHDKTMSSLKKRAPKAPEVKAEEPAVIIPELKVAEKSVSRVPSKDYKTNEVPTKTLTNRPTSLTSALPSHLSPEENKQRIIDKFRSLR